MFVRKSFNKNERNLKLKQLINKLNFLKRNQAQIIKLKINHKARSLNGNSKVKYLEICCKKEGVKKLKLQFKKIKEFNVLAVDVNLLRKQQQNILIFVPKKLKDQKTDTHK